MLRSIVLGLILSVNAAQTGFVGVASDSGPYQLLVEYLPSPAIGLGTTIPRFSWAANSVGQGAFTSAFQLVVAEELSNITVWDSGKFEGDVWLNSTVVYNGSPLKPDTQYSWTVRIWQNVNDSIVGPSPYADPARFHVGLIAKSDWMGAVSVASGISPPAPTPMPPVCQSNCQMIAIPAMQYHSGQYNETQAHNVSSIPDCIAVCLADPACVQITWAPSHPDKCVMYQSIGRTLSGGAQGWVKCNSTETDPNVCAPANQPPGAGAQLLRTTFTAPPQIATVTLYLSAVGWAEGFLNGKRVAPSDVLNPGRTSFDMRQWYLAYDVTDVVISGSENVFGIRMAAGWQSMPGHTLSSRALLSVTYLDESKNYVKSFVSTNTAWVGTTDGPITMANIYGGETYDARKEIPDWATVSFVPQAPQWKPVTQVTEYDITPVWQPMNPIRAIEVNTALTITSIVLQADYVGKTSPLVGQTVYVYQFPQNAAGTAILSVENCPAGTQLSMWYSENLCGYGPTRWSPPCPKGLEPGGGQFGTIDQRNYRSTEFTSYICKGGATEGFEATFTYTGFRNIELHGHTWAPATSKTLQQRVIHSDVEGKPQPMSMQNVPRVLAGSIAFSTSPQQGAVAPANDGPLCYEGEGCEGTRPVGAASNTSVLDQISHNVRWDLIDNLHSVPEDCDQRNERWGWMADASVSAEANYQYHWMPSLYTSWLTSMRDVQTEPSATCATAVGVQGDTNIVDGKPVCTGAVGDLTPGHTPAGLPGDPSWMFAYPLVFSYQYRYFGDKRLVQTLWGGIQSYTDFLVGMASRGKSGLVSWKKYGDWLEPGKVPSLDIIGEMSSSFNYGQTLRIVCNVASSLDDTVASSKYSPVLANVLQAFHKTYWNNVTQTYGDGTQAALVYALYLGAVPANLDATVFAKLIALIYKGTSQCDSTPCLDTGILATKWLMELLSERGRTDVGLDLAFKTDYPSWGYMARENATTIWEHWEYMNGDGMNSHAHPALASVGAWFYRWIVGLRIDDLDTNSVANSNYGTGWRHVVFSPGFVQDARVPGAQARVSTLYGPISVSWVNATGTIKLTVDVPPDVTARVVVPQHVGGGWQSVHIVESQQVVWEHGRQVDSLFKGITARVRDGCVELVVTAGAFSFEAR
eukprot:m.62571 g.62571  ORF g.62571 m.62571 type:complete len:1144 (-) comp23173_c0_seq2:336-3767(-)